MKYMIEYSASDAMFHDMIECKRVVEADSLSKAIKEAIESAKMLNQKILGITNYYCMED